MPLPWARPVPRVSENGKYYEFILPEHRKYQDLVRTIFYQHAVDHGKVFDYPFDGVAYLNVRSFFPKLKKYKNMLVPCDINKDWDNLGKQICDALQARQKVRFANADPITKKKSKWIRRFGAWENDNAVVLGISGKCWAPDENSYGTWVQMDFFRRTYERINISRSNGRGVFQYKG